MLVSVYINFITILNLVIFDKFFKIVFHEVAEMTNGDEHDEFAKQLRSQS
jgi:hypothetical protein